jgi:hypothetical protein
MLAALSTIGRRGSTGRVAKRRLDAPDVEQGGGRWSTAKDLRRRIEA